MEALEQKYKIELDSIKGAIQSSDLLAKYLEDEEDEDYQALRHAFEPQIESVYNKVVEENPLQLISLEKQLLDPDFEGLYLSKVIGYAVLRGEIDARYRYKRPQDHFKDVLLAICSSPNFDSINKRIGLSIQVGFSLSSDIWITNLINEVVNARVVYFLQSQKLDLYRDEYERSITYRRYAKQFQSHHFQSAEFPEKVSQLKTVFSALEGFLRFRVAKNLNNVSLLPNIKDFLSNKEFMGSYEYLQMLGLFAMYFDYSESKDWLKKRFNEERISHEKFNEKYFTFLLDLLKGKAVVGKEADSNVLAVLDLSIEDDMTAYYQLMDIVHSKGYIHEDAIEAVRNFYDRHAGLSVVNECLRLAIFEYFDKLMTNLPVEDYTSYFEINKTFIVYMSIFDNEQFNLQVKKLSQNYVRKLIKQFTDKRGKDYQDIKKFVTSAFLDMGFLNIKELKELFKTKRKKKVT